MNEKTIRNWYSAGYLGYHNIREGIVYSMNVIASRCLMETVTPQLGIEYAENMGISTLVSSDITPAAALGGLTYGVTNLELTSAFAAIANGGMYTEPCSSRGSWITTERFSLTIRRRPGGCLKTPPPSC